MRFFPTQQKGSVLILFAITIPLLFLFSAIAFDLGAVYIQRAHMQNIADAAALAGAKSLNGTTNDTDARNQASLYISQNNSDSDTAAGQTTSITHPYKNDLQKIQVTLAEDIPLYFFKYFGYNSMHLSVSAVASNVSSNALPDLWQYCIVSGGPGNFYLLGDWGSGSNKFHAPIRVNGKFQFDKNSANGNGTDTITGSGNEISDKIYISGTKNDTEIGGLNKPQNQVLKDHFVYGVPTIDITESNPQIKAKIDALTNKANTYSDSHPANQYGLVDVSKITSPLYVNGSFGSGYNAKNIVSGTYNNDLTIVATGDISLNFSAATFSNKATITLISLTGNIQVNGGTFINLNALAPHGTLTLVGGGTTMSGWLIGQTVTLGQGNKTYTNPNWSGSGSGNGKVSLIE